MEWIGVLFIDVSLHASHLVSRPEDRQHTAIFNNAEAISMEER